MQNETEHPQKCGPHPLKHRPQLDTAFLQSVVTAPNIQVGRYSYYHDPKGPENFQTHCVRYHFDFLGDQLKVGQFCAIATDVQFIMNGANHAMSGFSTFPFNIFMEGWEEGFDFSTITDQLRGDTVIGNDVWIGRGATIMPGVSIGHGAIIGSQAVVASDVPDYAIIVGNPGKVVRKRFDDATIRTLLEIAWWDWPIENITKAVNAIRGADLAQLVKYQPR